jgi:hypothetical protein
MHLSSPSGHARAEVDLPAQSLALPPLLNRPELSPVVQLLAGTARLATGDIANSVGRLCEQPGEGVVAIGGAWPRRDAIAESQAAATAIPRQPQSRRPVERSNLHEQRSSTAVGSFVHLIRTSVHSLSVMLTMDAIMDRLWPQAVA